MRVVRSRLHRLLKLPSPPEAPAGDRLVQRVRAAPVYLRLRRIGWLIEQIGTLIGIVVGLVLLDRFVPEPLSRWVWPLEVAGVVFWLVQMPVTYALLELDYDQRVYLISDRSLRIREGIFRVKEQTLTFANIQNLSLHQGPLQRWLGICDLEVHTAGGGQSTADGGGTTGHHKGRLRGVAEGEALRSLILARVRKAVASPELGPDGSLGSSEGDEVGSPAPSQPDSLAAVAGDLLREVRLWRETAAAARVAASTDG